MHLIVLDDITAPFTVDLIADMICSGNGEHELLTYRDKDGDGLNGFDE